MIAGFRDRWLEDFFVDDKPSRNIPPDLESRLFRKLQLLDDSSSDADLRVPPSNHLEKLRGDRAGQYSIRINERYRICFRWVNQEADDVEIVDYH